MNEDVRHGDRPRGYGRGDYMDDDVRYGDTPRARGRSSYLRVPRSKGALTGLLLMALGVWGALIPFVGPYFHYAYTPDSTWTWTSGRFWLEVLPGAAVFVGGFLLLMTANRAVAHFGAWLAAAGGAWFIVGPIFGQLWNGPEGAAGVPVGGTSRRVVEQIGFFYGLGAVILFLSALALGRFMVRSVRDIRAAEQHAERRDVGRRATEPRRYDEGTTYPAAEPRGVDERTTHRAAEETGPYPAETPVETPVAETPERSRVTSRRGAHRAPEDM